MTLESVGGSTSMGGSSDLWGYEGSNGDTITMDIMMLGVQQGDATNNRAWRANIKAHKSGGAWSIQQTWSLTLLPLLPVWDVPDVYDDSGVLRLRANGYGSLNQLWDADLHWILRNA